MDAVQRLLAVEEIKALKYRYWRACDAKDPAGFRACFVDRGAHVALGSVGTFDDADEAAAAYERLGCQMRDGEYVVHDMHHGLHPVITLDSETTARGRWTLRFRQVNTVDRYEVVSSGDYEDEYVVEDGVWKIRSSDFHPAWGMRRPLPPEVAVGPLRVWDR